MENNRRYSESEDINRRLQDDKWLEFFHGQLLIAQSMLCPIVVVKCDKSEIQYPESHMNNGAWFKAIELIRQQIEDRKNFIINGYGK